VKEFYENLKKKRKEKGISLEDIHQKSRLSLDYLNAIEAGQIEKLPVGYERIYLKRYAKEVGLDEEEVLHCRILI
jgi:cytoskeletal protein RodZ